MTTWMKVALGAWAFCLYPMWAMADIRPDPPSKPKEQVKLTVPFTVKVDPAANFSTLQIPANLLPAPGKAQAEAAPVQRSLIAGLALAGAACASVFLMRGRKRLGVGLSLGLVAVVVMGLIGTAVANAPFPAEPPSPALPFSGRVSIEIVPRGNAVLLIVPPPSVERNPDSR